MAQVPQGRLILTRVLRQLLSPLPLQRQRAPASFEVPSHFCTLANHHSSNSLQMTPLKSLCFCPKIRGLLQKNKGPTEIILNFFSCFLGFSAFLTLQAVVFQPLTAFQPLPKKSCQKHYGRFFVRFGMCHNRRVKVEMSDRNEGCDGWRAIKRQPAFRAKRFGVRNDSFAFGRPAETRRWRVRTPKPLGFSGAHQTQLFKSLPPKRSVAYSRTPPKPNSGQIRPKRIWLGLAYFDLIALN
jgi:hypothetical protein